MATFKMKMEKNHFKIFLDRFCYNFDTGSQDAILNIPMETQQHLFSFNLFKAYTF